MMLSLIIILGLPFMAVVASFHANSRVALLLLRWCGGYFLGANIIFALMDFDCKYSNFAYQQCRFTPNLIADILSDALLVHVLLFMSAAPVLLLVALVFEWRKRSSGQSSRTTGGL